jgi:hypothetical protein
MYRIAALVTLSALSLGLMLYAADEPTQTFKGEISDSQCALNVHSLTRSHQEMLKGKNMGSTPSECSRYCLENLGGKLVLVSGKEVHYLDGPETLMQFLGKKIKVRGTLEKANNTIHVTKIEDEDSVKPGKMQQ